MTRGLLTCDIAHLHDTIAQGRGTLRIPVSLWVVGSSIDCMHATVQVPAVALAPPLLVYDGNCGFCSRAVQFILRHERRHDLQFVPRDSEFGQELRRRFHLEAVESMLWIDGNRAFTESNAVLSSGKYVGGIWGVLSNIAWLVPSSLRNWAYRFIARNRRRLSSGLPASCLVPTPEQRARFLS